MTKPITWYALWKRLGKQQIGKTRNKYVNCLINNEMWYCRLVYTNNGSDFHLEPIRKEIINDKH